MQHSVRAGASLVELLVAMTITGIVLGTIATISVREQRVFGDAADASALEGQLRDAASVLPIDVRALAPGAGDLRIALDTAIELRSTIGTAVVCDTTPSGDPLLAPTAAGAVAFAGLSSPVDAGDTAWILVPNDSAERWEPHRIASARFVRGGQCLPDAPQLPATTQSTARLALSLAPPSGAAGSIGTPIRITRPVRYSLYRSADGDWYLGERDWNTVAARFNIIQPVSGPFMSPTEGGFTIAYLDSAGVPLADPVVDAAQLSFVRVTVRGKSKHIERARSSATTPVIHTDSASAVILLRNRR